MKPIPIYTAEKEAGLEMLVRANASFAYLTKPKIAVDPNKDSAMQFCAVQRAVAENKNQIDLFYMQDIMVTTGINLNDDVFLNEETFAARHTPEDKPFNLIHDSVDIIGHITGQHLINEAGEVIEDDIAVDELPEKYHVVNNTVIYRYWPDEERMKQVNQIIAEIQEGDKWFVSMEAIFSNFDYGIVTADNKLEIIPRTKTTAFLTKHLKAYKGEGTYKNNRLCRVLRDFVFSGKGLVENPGNPNSVILNDTKPFFVKNSQLLENIGYVLSSKDNTENKMDEIQELKNKLEATKASLATAETARVDAEKKLKDMDLKSYQTQIDELTQKVSASASKVTELTAEVKASKEAADKVIADKAVVEVSLKEANEQLQAIASAKVKTDRIATLVKSLGVDENQAIEIFETVAELSDDKFAKFVEKSPKVVKAEKVVEKTEKQEDKDIKALEAAKAEKSTGAVPEPENKINQAVASISKFYEAKRKKTKTQD